MTLKIKQAKACHFDIVSLGEVMLRFDPSDSRIRRARSFDVWEGGGEYNVARGLRRCFSQRAGVVTGAVKNELGYLLEDLILQGGLDTSLIRWFDFDGIGHDVRNSLNFTERGFGLRGALGCSDRGHSATSKIQPGDIDWNYLFGELGVRWFHTGGIYAALSESAFEVTLEALKAAKRHGTITSYDLNYRPSLWQSRGGLDACYQANQKIAEYVDVMIGFPGLLGIEQSANESKDILDADDFKQIILTALERFPNIKAYASSIRVETTASSNDWSAISWLDGNFNQSISLKDLQVLDRVGGGDSFAAGYIYGLMVEGDAQVAVDYGIAHGALAMTTPGDNSMASLDEIKKVIAGSSSATDR
ncbi:carbohydrate kinase, pfkB family protein [Marinomonas sp. MED121]|uniref:sugar kinase n=1 Tax=Marinomonas sp. MED121 TaxID=314277 RepID=UPI0000691165|nr:sugar kinase [Marinomonas sp. MED121]EAQ67740.1 carbohydrate kinase, pfkB family protein [Marinomonas sp. MED121]